MLLQGIWETNLNILEMKNFLRLVISIAVCELVGVVSSIFTRYSVFTWYRTLDKPYFNPPGSVFAPVWITLYFIMGIAAFLIWKQGLEHKGIKFALLIFIIQLVFNMLWSIAFFGMHSLLGGLAVIIILWAAIFMTILGFSEFSRFAGALLIPYFLWVTYASILNYFIWKLN